MLRAFACAVLAVAVGGAGAACTSSSGAAVDAGADVTATDGAPSDAAANVPSADAKVGDPCAFNRECGKTERCECDEATGCACRTGARGTGKSGVDPCVSGNDCASSVCVEGLRNKFFCSGECTTNAECGSELPVCADVALVGRICIRNPDGG